MFHRRTRVCGGAAPRAMEVQPGLVEDEVGRGAGLFQPGRAQHDVLLLQLALVLELEPILASGRFPVALVRVDLVHAHDRAHTGRFQLPETSPLPS